MKAEKKNILREDEKTLSDEELTRVAGGSPYGLGEENEEENENPFDLRAGRQPGISSDNSESINWEQLIEG